uniref:Decapping nuclease n=2 Tax=Sarcoptes scabiei TaxID=52283 RepID=A0A834R8D6_SARSC
MTDNHQKYNFRDIGSFHIGPSITCDPKEISKDHVDFQKPQKIGEYSLNVFKNENRREIKFDQSNLSYLKSPSKTFNSRLNLNKNFREYDHLNWCADSANKIDDFLKWILRNKHYLRGHQNSLQLFDCDFICYRGLLTQLIVTPFLEKDKWYIGASKFKGNIYLCQYKNFDSTEFLNLMSYGGHLFERLMTTDSLSENDDIHGDPISVQKQYAAVIKTKIGTKPKQVRMIYAAEMDCLDFGLSDPTKLENFVEIKTTMRMQNERQLENFERFKLIKWWAQCYLAAIPKIICGYKDRSHFIERIESIRVEEIPNLCSKYWTKRQCLGFLQNFLLHVRECLRDENDPTKVYLFSYDEKHCVIECKKLYQSGNFRILPDWYLEEFTDIEAIKKNSHPNS